MFFKLTAALVAALFVSACQEVEITKPPAKYKLTKNVNPKVDTIFMVRAQAITKEGRKEITGVPCKMTTPVFTATFEAPSYVNAPNLGQSIPPGSLTCTYQGQKKLVVMQVINQTLAAIDRETDPVGHGLIPLLIADIAYARKVKQRDPSQDVYGYPNAYVVFDMRPKKKQ